MFLKKLAVRNFRRLRDVEIDLASDISIFVGANNSGKTSVGHALQLFTGRGRFDIHDFSVELWADIIAFGHAVEGAALPTMEIEIWFEIGASDVHRIIDLLPSLAWEGSLVGMRVIYGPVDPRATQERYSEARQRALEAVPPNEDGERDYDPSPRNLQDFLRDRLKDEYELRHYVLDPARIGQANYQPMELAGRDRSGRDVLAGLLQIDFLHAQRHLSDGPGGARAEELSRVLSRFYARNLEQKAEDLETLRALSASEIALNDHLKRVFGDTLQSLSKLGYPGLTNPRLIIRSTLDPAQIMSSRDGARVHYALGPEPQEGDKTERPTLPDRYNGLGFKNLIFMVVELLDLHQQWLAIEDNRPPVHLIFIEEPEAHLHAQLQQVFIRKVMSILKLKGDDRTHYTSQVVVTTHSTHILYERGFRPIRYFRRSRAETASTSDIVNLSVFYDGTDLAKRSFLERYLKLTHCDLFFADAAVLVEGNVERILLPQMIAKVAPRLQSTYLTLLEIGGAFGHKFKALIEFLGLTTLIITDLDSVIGQAVADDATANDYAGEAVGAANGGGTVDEKDDGDDEEENEAVDKPGKSCVAGHPGAATSNQTLRQWLPQCTTVAALWSATDEQKTQPRLGDRDALVRVAYQCPVEVNWGGETEALAGRTLEEAFALENLAWCQELARRPLQLRIQKNGEKDLTTLVAAIHKRVNSSSFNKTDFSLALLAENPDAWIVPSYIARGLEWLEEQIAPPEPEEEDDAELLAGAAEEVAAIVAEVAGEEAAV
ncbi:ATP-dependent nuclease [Asaia bogorensis]|uniref:ATP-dependent nuclease n=1 Tax=Asaia bogorensis TaxID=91915 RepID=UPI0030170E7C